MILRGQHFRSATVIDVHIEDQKIVTINDSDSSNSADVQADVLAPAYFDLQINGGQGINFTSAALTPGYVDAVVSLCATHGIAGFCPTVITAAPETIAAAFSVLSNACTSSRVVNQALPCFHLEGPFISPEDGPRGAHPREHVRSPDIALFQRWQDAAQGRIKLVTLAPEVPGALPLIDFLVKQNVVVSLGHSAAAPPVIRDAIAAGARLSTHLGNGCARMLPRHENILWEQLAADNLLASIIPDGHHLPWNLVRCIVRCKTLERMIITCDASPLAGLPPGRYTPWGSEVEITTEGKIVLSSQGVLAGSWEFTSACVEKMMQNIGLSYAEIHPLACAQPRQLLDLPVPTLEVSQPADLVLLKRDHTGQLRHHSSLIRGKIIPHPPSVVPPDGVAH